MLEAVDRAPDCRRWPFAAARFLAWQRLHGWGHFRSCINSMMQTYPDEIQGAFDCASDALHAALIAARDNGFWVGIGVGELRIPRRLN